MFLFIRTDGNNKIGLGHVMRCLSIADRLKKGGYSIIFVCADNECEDLIRKNNHAVMILNTQYDNLDSETDKLVDLIKINEIKLLLLDSYYVTKEYMQSLRNATKLVYIDDINAFIYPCDVLINYNICSDKYNYPLYFKNIDLLLGVKYVPLRDEFTELPMHFINKTVKSVLILSGGTDPYNIAGILCETFQKNKELKSLDIHVVSGKFNSNLSQITKISQTNDHIFIYYDLEKISTLMLSCDVAISAGGSTLYELCACGIPTICYSFVDNQLDIVEKFNESIMYYAGDIRNDINEVILNIKSCLSSWMYDNKKRSKLSKKMQALIDGKGSERIMNYINNIYLDN